MITDEQQRLQQFFNELNAKRKAFRESYQYVAPQLAPQFNCFDFIDSDENKLSEIVAHLLNPHATHAQNDLFLRLFFEEIKIDYPNYNQQVNKVNVKCEVVIQNNRRIDILIDFGKDCFGLAIENKPWATDQNEQLSDYNKYLGNIYGNKYCLIYLSGNDSDPSENSITKVEREQLEKSNHYKKINFSDIVSWLKQCEKESKSDHVKHFLRDFIAYCQQEFSGETNMIDRDVIEKTILENDDNIGLALEIAAQLPAMKEKLLKKFRSDLENKFTEKYPDWVFEDNEGFYYGTGNNPIFFYKKRSKNYSFLIDYEGGLYWGVKRKDDTRVEDEKRESLNRKLPERLKQSGYWPYCYFPDPYKNWKKNIEPWIGIQSGKTVELVIEK